MATIQEPIAGGNTSASDEELAIATATLVGVVDIESAEQITSVQVQAEPLHEAADSISTGKNAGKGIGIAMLSFIIIGGICGLTSAVAGLPDLTFVAFICGNFVIILATILACACCSGCCNLENIPAKSRGFVCIVLISTVLIFVTYGIGTAEVYAEYSYIVWAVIVPLYILAVVFTVLFIWGRACCCRSNNTS